ncbi:heparan-sulfate 6-O-sulfotransferase 2 isoform X1 [Myxocyprinus asiaticus]|uniref:heparan-sulfate 6-O-sulfotransferase 2 isoform X1 n=1 Tax=Myxocyprinus asiaticus TaxID=70543 RepID=UPI0022221E87|nr:heparan-sulfate 6-O-sulfotransferase 2 isoform X1 [Myxocyprinus asiaticus]
MDEKSNYSRILIALVMVLLFAVIVLQYVCPTSDCQLLHLASLSSRLGSRAPGDHTGGINGASAGDPYSSEDGALARFVPRFNFTTKDLYRVVEFNIKENDVIVFLHIQKTGGTTFGRHLVRNIQLERPCECYAGQKKCTCYRPGKRDTWLFSRFSTGWSCGLHADWTELTNCVPSFMNTRESQERRRTPSRNYYYITILRDPVWRYLSEWRHVQRGATWKASKHMCDGRLPTLTELPSCYTSDDWSGCSLEEFMACPYNLANNRQTRMLADLSLVGCYNLSVMSESQRWAVLLESAKRNLRNMAFFGLTEYQRKTQYLFEQTFRLSFIAPFTQLNGTRATSVEVEPETQWRIRELNQWDVELYEYARDLFLQRFQYARQQERREARQRRLQERRKLRAKVKPWWGVTGKVVFKPTKGPQLTEQSPILSFSEEKQTDMEQKLETETEEQVEDNWLQEDDSEAILDYLENVEQWR